MNKFKFALLVAVLAIGTSASAQKTGYISLDDIIRLMPETGKIDSLLQRYQQDSIAPQYNYLMAEYQRKDSMLSGKDSMKYKGAVGNQIRQELEGIVYQIQNWQQIATNASEGKQSELLQPIYTKAMNALKAVSKANGYTHVYNRQALLIAPDGDDLSLLVLKQLGIKDPRQTAAAAVPKK